MPLCFLLVEARFFHEDVCPALAAAWRRRSFQPCQALCIALLSTVASQRERFHLGPDEPLLVHVARGMLFERRLWSHLAGELLWFGAVETPDIQTCPDTLCRLLGLASQPESVSDRRSLPPILQAHYGSRALSFGGVCYRPDHSGFNDVGDVARLAEFFTTIDPQQWSAGDLANRDQAETDDELADELAFTREWFVVLADLYERARRADWIVVCESI